MRALVVISRPIFLTHNYYVNHTAICNTMKRNFSVTKILRKAKLNGASKQKHTWLAQQQNETTLNDIVIVYVAGR